MGLLDEIQRPTLLLDQERCRANIARMAEKARRNGVRFRPHFKTHQSAAIGEWFRPFGVTAITVSSVDMADYFARHAWQDITIAFSLNWRQIETVDRLAGEIHLGILVESQETVAFAGERLTHPVDAWIKVDVGAHRTGVPVENAEEIIALAGAIRRSDGIHLKGLLTHAGHTYHAAGKAEVTAIYQDSLKALKSLAGQMAQAGFTGLELSVGDTPACSLVDDLGGVDEIRPGNFVFYDAAQWQIGSCAEEDIAVAVACPVVAKHPERNEIVIYGGAVHLSKETMTQDGRPIYGLPAYPDGQGWGKTLPNAYVTSLSQEHGLVRVAPADFERIAVGDLLMVLPVHSCLAVDCLRSYLTLQGETIQAINK